MGILIGSGELMGSFLAGSPAHVEQIDRQSIKWGSRIPHALFHQTGTGTGFQRRVKGSGRGMPMRKIIDLNAAAKRAMRSVMVQRMSTIARREGFGISTGLGLDPLAARMVGLSALGL
jgi:hypothetical protein